MMNVSASLRCERGAYGGWEGCVYQKDCIKLYCVMNRDVCNSSVVMFDVSIVWTTNDLVLIIW